MKTVGMLIQEGYQPRSPALWEKVFPHVGEAGNTITITHNVDDVKNFDACIIASPLKHMFRGNFIYDCGTPENTDMDGFAKMKPWMPKDVRILVLGTGYLADTVMSYLWRCGYGSLYVWGRSIGKALKLANDHNSHVMPTQDIEHGWFEVVVNCIPYNKTLEVDLMHIEGKLINLVWGKHADELAIWQSAYAQNLIYPTFSVDQLYEWMKS